MWKPAVYSDFMVMKIWRSDCCALKEEFYAALALAGAGSGSIATAASPPPCSFSPLRAREHASNAQVKAKHKLQFIQLLSSLLRRVGACLASARLRELYFLKSFEVCLARGLRGAVKPPAAAPRRASPPGRLRGAARALCRWTAWSIPADPPSAAAASSMTSLSR